MKTYDVTITATVTKTIRVEALTQDAAIEAAHERFSVEADDTDERYTEHTDNVEEVK
jgi:hypothetical protein